MTGPACTCTGPQVRAAAWVSKAVPWRCPLCGRMTDPVVYCTGRHTHPAAEAARRVLRPKSRPIQDQHVTAEWRCPVCGRTVRLGERARMAWAEAGTLPFDLSFK